MGSSLQEQFLKMGLVDKKKVHSVKKAKHDQRKKGQQSEAADIAEMTKQGLAEKKRKDQQLNKKKIAAREVKEASAKARQLIDTHKIEYEKGSTPYKFTDNKIIKKIYLAENIIENLVAGKIGIVKQAGEYQLVPADIIYKVRELNDKVVVLLNSSPSKNTADDDDPYAEFQVPDDLMW